VVARVDRLAGIACHPAPVTDGCKRTCSPKPPTSRCIKPWPVCSPPLKANSPVRERALPKGTTGGSGGSHSVGKSGRDYFSTHNKQLYERNEVSARGRYMGDFQERDQGNHVEIEVVRPDTPPTPGGPESEENTTIIVTLETARVDLAAPPTPGDASLELRAPTPPTPGTPVVWDLCGRLPGSVSLCVASRVHSLLSACPAFNRIDSRVQPVTFPPGPEVAPMVCTVTSGGLSLVNQRRKEVQAGSVCQLNPTLNQPTCEFIHCPCSVCDQFRAVHTSWKTAPCLQQPGCKCPLCRSAFNSQGHWDPAKMDRLCTIRGLSMESMGVRTIVKGVWQTLQRTPLRQWLSLEPPRCYVAPTVRTWTPQEWREIKKDARLVLRDRRQAFFESKDRQRLQIHSEKVTANKLLLLHQRKTGSIAQHMGYVKRVSSTGLDTKGKHTTILPILLAASMSVGPTWERARLLVDSWSEHPPLISQSLADWMGLRGPLAGGATQANGDYLPLYDVGQLHMGLNGRTVTENFCRLHFLIMISF